MLFSIITINYNNREGLLKTIKSVLEQSFDDYEYIIIDGGSTDGSIDILKEYAIHLDYWVSERDRGIYHAMNKGVGYAQGEYCVFMNSGDSFYSKEVLKQVAAMGFEDDIIVGDVVSTKDGKVIPTRPARELSLYHLYSVSIPHQASFIRTSLLHKYPYDDNLKIASDWKFFLQTIILDNCSFRYIDVIVAEYDYNGISTQNVEALRLEKNQILDSLFPQRILLDYKWMKSTECKTQLLTSQLRNRYQIDRLLFRLGSFLLKVERWHFY